MLKQRFGCMRLCACYQKVHIGCDVGDEIQSNSTSQTDRTYFISSNDISRAQRKPTKIWRQNN